MNWHDLKLRARALRSRDRAEGDLDDELQFHLEMEARKLQSRGMTPDEARRRARVGFNGFDRVREECRDIRGLTLLENLARDVRYGLRMLRKSPVFTTVAVLSLAVGIGANTAVFSLIDAVLLRMLPVKNPEQLVILKWGTRADIDFNRSYASNGEDRHGRHSTNVVSWPVYRQLRSRSRTLDAVMAFSPLRQVSVAGNGQALVTEGMVVSGNYFSGLGVPALAGRLLTSDDETADGIPSIVISFRLWDRLFGLDPAAIGKVVYVNAQPCAVVGVTPRSFFGLSRGAQSDVMVPIRLRDRVTGAGRRADYFADDLHWIQVIARRNPHVTDAAIEGEVGGILGASLPDSTRRRLAGETPYASAEPAGQGLADLRTTYRNPLLLIMAVVGITLLMACANLAGLLLARANSRGREILVRLALGARRGRVVRQLLVEGAILSVAGAALGVAIAWWGVEALLKLLAAGRSPIELQATPDARVLLFTIGVTMATTLLFALAPAVRATRIDVAHGLKEETSAGGGHRHRAVRVLVAAQIAVALPLVAGATLLERTLLNLRSIPLGFNPGNLVLFDLEPGHSGYDPARAALLYTRVLERLRQTPGVMGASASTDRILAGYVSNGQVFLDNRTRGIDSDFNYVGPDFFEVMQIPLVAGRAITLRDMAPEARVAVVNEAFARKHFRSSSPLGHRFRWDRRDPFDLEIVGIVRDAKYDHLKDDPPVTIYAPYTQSGWGFPERLSFAVRFAGNAAPAVAAVRRTMSEIDRSLPLTDMKTQQAQIDGLIVQERLFAWLISLFGAITLGLACVGLYGSIAASVTGRTREIGVRMALGAGKSAVLRMVLGQAALTAGLGIAAGLLATWASTRVVESLLFGVTPRDPLTLTLAAAAVLSIALAAACLPARRATCIDPVRALRYE